DRGIISSRGKQWTGHGVVELLKNERYLGHMIYGQRCSSKYKTKDNPRGKVQVLPRDQWTIIRNTHPAIVSVQVFNAVQDRLKKNRSNTAPTSKNRYALTGLIYCGACGHRMLGQASPRETQIRLLPIHSATWGV
ncbi:TnpX site-specific recombinase, partial [Rhodopirellula maiorica SM1]